MKLSEAQARVMREADTRRQSNAEHSSIWPEITNEFHRRSTLSALVRKGLIKTDAHYHQYSNATEAGRAWKE